MTGANTAATTGAAAAQRARVLAGSVRVTVEPRVFEEIAARADGPVVHTKRWWGEYWYAVYGGFVFKTKGVAVSMPAGVEVVEAKSAE